MSEWIGYLATGLVVWVAVAIPVALLVGGAIRRRDRQVPKEGR